MHEKADLREANLNGAIIADAKLGGARLDEGFCGGTTPRCGWPRIADGVMRLAAAHQDAVRTREISSRHGNLGVVSSVKSRVSWKGEFQ
jgi:hypothetical protein